MRRILEKESKLCCIVSSQQLSTADPTPQSWLFELNTPDVCLTVHRNSMWIRKTN